MFRIHNFFYSDLENKTHTFGLKLKKKSIVFLIFFLTVINHGLKAQPQISNWFFAKNNGLSFSSSQPSILSGGQVTMAEGASTISDKIGQLLFYSDGITVWNKNHEIMENGIGLAGGALGSSTQGCLIVPKPNNEDEYFVFTTDEQGGTKGLQYSTVSMAFNNGLGKVILKNELLLTPCTEKITAVKHCNKKDYWVITHKYDSDAYYAYLVTGNGVNPVPVISHTGSFVYTGFNTMIGSLKASPDGKYLIALHSSIAADLSNFNNQTGQVSNTTNIFSNNYGNFYGAEFSINSDKLYISVLTYWNRNTFYTCSGIFQYDLSSPLIADIKNSEFEVYQYYPPNTSLGSLQRGPDNRIYLAQYNLKYLSVINNPEISGSGCNFVDKAIDLPFPGGGGLPNFVTNYNISLDTFKVVDTNLCINKPVRFEFKPGKDVTSILWNFGDSTSGNQNQSVVLNPQHVFNTPGTYTIELIIRNTCGDDTVRKQISVGDISVFIGTDTLICQSQQYTITPVIVGAGTYLWQNGATTPTLNVSLPGMYWLEFKDNVSGCAKSDSIVISLKPTPTIDLGKDTVICKGESLLLNAYYDGAKYKWSTNDTSSTLLINNQGKYWVDVSLNGCSVRDSIFINTSTLSPPQFSLGEQKYLCPGEEIILSPGLRNVSYYWQNGSRLPSYKITKPGLYYVRVSNICGTSIDSVNIIDGNCILRLPSAFSPNNDGLNDKFYLSGVANISKLEMRIFDRAGQQVFFTNDKYRSWDGTYKGFKMPVGVYVYTLRYTEVNSTKIKIQEGTITLLR